MKNKIHLGAMTIMNGIICYRFLTFVILLSFTLYSYGCQNKSYEKEIENFLEDFENSLRNENHNIDVIQSYFTSKGYQSFSKGFSDDFQPFKGLISIFEFHHLA